MLLKFKFCQTNKTELIGDFKKKEGKKEKECFSCVSLTPRALSILQRFSGTFLIFGCTYEIALTETHINKQHFLRLAFWELPHFQLVLSQYFLIVTSINTYPYKYSKLLSYPVTGEQNRDGAQGSHLINDSFTLITSCHYTVFLLFCAIQRLPAERKKKQQKNNNTFNRRENQSWHNYELLNMISAWYSLGFSNADVIYERLNYIMHIHATVDLPHPQLIHRKTLHTCQLVYVTRL